MRSLHGKSYAGGMNLWVGLSLYGGVLAVLAFLNGRFGRDPRAPFGLAFAGAAFGTNLVLLDRGAPVDARLLPCVVAGAVAGVTVVAWQTGRDARS